MSKVYVCWKEELVPMAYIVLPNRDFFIVFLIFRRGFLTLSDRYTV